MVFADTASKPDVFGLPIYRINKTIVEVVDGEVHVLCGTSLFDQVIWQYVAVMSNEDYLRAREQYNVGTQLIEHSLGFAH